MALSSRLSASSAPRYPAGRYTRTNPLRREFGLRRLTEALPESLRRAIFGAFRHPARYDGNEAIQTVHRQRPGEAQLFCMSPRGLGILAHIELEASRRVLEAPLASISRETRNALLTSQSVYLWQIYTALARQVGETLALAEFQRLLLRMR